MAFYHVGSCSCPMGCCDCGSDNTTSKTKRKLTKKQKEEREYEAACFYIAVKDGDMCPNCLHYYHKTGMCFCE